MTFISAFKGGTIVSFKSNDIADYKTNIKILVFNEWFGLDKGSVL